ncbi:cytochrome P450 [Rhizoctonia solani]|nr:cytochrome P450 [Rhizoctonia solani]
MNSLVLTNVLAAVVGSTVLVGMTYSWLLPKPLANIPHNPVTSIWGDLPAIAKAKKGGRRPFMDSVCDVISMRDRIVQILIGRHILVIISDIKETERLMFDSRVTELPKRINQAFGIVLPNGQLAMRTDDKWKRHRRLAGPSMSRRYLERMSTRISTSANNLAKLWKAKMNIAGACAFDACLDIQLATMDNIVGLTTGAPLGCIEATLAALTTGHIQSTGVMHFPHPNPPPLFRAILRMLETIEAATKALSPSLYGRFVKFTSASWRKEYATLSAFVNNQISESRKREEMNMGEKLGSILSTDADCVVDMIIQREAREGVEAFGEGEIHDELLLYVFGGQDTTAALLRWLVKYLPQDPEIQHRLHKEVCSEFGGEDDVGEYLDFNAIDDPERMPLLEAVIVETLRCAGVAAQTGRELIQDATILGRFVPRGTQLVFAMALMSRDKEAWGPDADEWRPTRWLTPDGAFDRSAGPSLPFGLGQRSCFGQRLAMLQAKIFTATLSRSFFFKPVPPEVDSWEAYETVTKQPEQCYVSLEGWEKK